jgi:glycosyltransferase domain-containing protein
MSKLTIILLIKGRENFTKRWLDYMSRINYQDDILIGDGDLKTKIKKLIENKRYSKLKIKYFNYNNRNYKDYYFMMYDLISRHVNTEYVRFCDNDDFILQDQQKNLITYFNKNVKLASVGDFQIRFEILDNNKIYGDKLYFFFEGIHRFSERFSEKTIKEMFKNYQELFYNIFKKKHMKKLLYEIYKLNFSDLEIRDFYFKLRLLSFGDTIYLKQSSYIRQHATSQTSSNFYYSENFFSKDIKNDTSKLVNKISNIYKKKFNKNPKKIKKIIRDSYKNYLNIVIAHNKRVFLYPRYFKLKNIILQKYKFIFHFLRKLQNLTFNSNLNKLYRTNKISIDKEIIFLKKFIQSGD